MKRLIALVQIALLVGVVGANYSCADFLEKAPPQVIGGPSLENAQGVEGLLTGTYSAIRGTATSQAARFGASMASDITYGSIASDDAYKGTDPGDQAANFTPLERYEALPGNTYMLARWQECYDGVARANQTLDYLRTVVGNGGGITAERALTIEAEARFLRAWFHFQANKVFRNIPYIMTSEEMGGKAVGEIENTDAAWSQIEADLQFAIDNLPTNAPTGEPGRADKWSAEAVKAQVHMYQNEFGDARTLLDDILDNGGFTLAPNFNDNFDEATENNSESIFEMQASVTSTNHTAMRWGGAIASGSQPGLSGWGFYQPSQTLVDAFQVTEDGLPILDVARRETVHNDMGIASDQPFTPTTQPLDPRLDWTVSRRGIPFLDYGLWPGAAWIRNQPNGGPYMTKKFSSYRSSPLSSDGLGFNGRNVRLYRLSHIILWRAEVAVEDDQLDLARTLVNRIRERAKTGEWVMGLSSNTTFGRGEADIVDMSKPAANYRIEPYPERHPAFASQAEARKAVRMEIQLEFATEGHRFFDLRRWGIDVEVLNRFIEDDTQFRTFMHGSKYAEKNRYWPLPQAQIDLQQGVLKQDSNY
ncbi:MAG: RagB/SusD family nutrient uptake outer membrane protein [Alistipes sp.]|nr:RagB/SusD family nutrient uptake outer membrane protein [Alistipes sp.]